MALLSEKILRRLFYRRSLLTAASGAGLLSVLGFRLYQLQITQNEQYRLMADDNRMNMRLLTPLRGRILSRTGFIIADSVPHYQILMDMAYLRTHKVAFGDSLKNLMNIINITEEELDKIDFALSQPQRNSTVPLIEHIDWERFSTVARNIYDLQGVELAVGSNRAYLDASIFCHITGHIGSPRIKDREIDPDPLLHLGDFKIGRNGLEQKYESFLRGKGGSVQLEVNSRGQVVRELSRIDALRGSDVVLTIDDELQRFAVNRLNGETGSIVVLDIQTGNILCLVSTPGYDPSKFTNGISHKEWKELNENEKAPLVNKAISGVYPPGSTFKMVTALAALRAGIIDANTTVYCPGFYEYGHAKFHCWKRGGHGFVNLKESLKHSCDTFYYDIALKTGINGISAMARELGLGDITHIPLPSEKKGNIPTKEWWYKITKREWSPSDTIITGIGQGSVLTTPLQLAVMTARLAHGKALPPIKLVLSPDDHNIITPEIASSFAHTIPAEHINMVKEGMWAVVNENRGTAHSARITDEGLWMAGKTGTAQVRRITKHERKLGVRKNDDLPWNLRDHALFVAYAPTVNPRFSISVVIEHGGSGSAAAAPIARDVLLKTMEVIKIRPD